MFRLRVVSVGDVRRLLPDGIKTVASVVKVETRRCRGIVSVADVRRRPADGSLGAGALRRVVSNRRRLKRLLRTKLHAAGKQYEEAKRAYADARTAATVDLPTDEEGHAKIVCRRYAEKRRVSLDEAARPHCYDADHRDCRGCVEDIRDGRVETW